MDYKVEEKPAFRLIAKSKEFRMAKESHLVGEFWQEMMEKYHDRFIELLDQAEPKAFLGLYSQSHDKPDLTKVGIGIQSTSKNLDGFEAIELPASRWAIFPVVGPSMEAVPQAWAQVFETLKKDGLNLGLLPYLEVYLAEDVHDPNGYNEIWLPLK